MYADLNGFNEQVYVPLYIIKTSHNHKFGENNVIIDFDFALNGVQVNRFATTR